MNERNEERSQKMKVNGMGVLRLKMMTKSVFMVIAIFLLVLRGGMFRDAKADISSLERDSFIALYNSTDADNWTDNSGWKEPPLEGGGFAMPGTENTWDRITCDGGNATVLNSKDPDLEHTQTIAPKNVGAHSPSDTSIKVSRTPIVYAADSYGSRVFCSTTFGGPYTLFDTTADKSVSETEITGLNSNTAHYFVVQTQTEPHSNNQNTAYSEYSKKINIPTSTTTITAPTTTTTSTTTTTTTTSSTTSTTSTPTSTTSTTTTTIPNGWILYGDCECTSCNLEVWVDDSKVSSIGYGASGDDPTYIGTYSGAHKIGVYRECDGEVNAVNCSNVSPSYGQEVVAYLDTCSLISGTGHIAVDGIIQAGVSCEMGWNLYFPHIDTTDPWETEIAIINTSSAQTLSGTLNALNDDGQLIDTISITLNPNARRQIIISQEFTQHANIRYLALEADIDTIQGYTKFYIEGTYRVAVPVVKEINTFDIYVSHIDSSTDWWTGLSLVNTTDSQKTVTITFNTGEIETRNIPSKGHSAFTVKSLFGESKPDIESALITNAEGIVGLELFGSADEGNYLSGILLKDDTTSTIYYPHIASDDIWWTGIVAYNTWDSATNITITPYTEGGTPLSPQSLSIDGRAKYIGTVADLGLPPGTAWFSIDATDPITGFELFGTNDGNQLAGYTGVGIKAREGVFAKVEKNGWTGVAFVNTEDAAASVTLTAYNNQGIPVATQMISLDSHAKVVDLVENIFSGKDITTANYIGYSSDREIVGFQLNGSSDAMLLDGLPGM
jgi:hypothetical protein